MSKQNLSSLEELLVLNNYQILGAQVRLTEIVWKYEGIKWNDAQRKASELIKTNTAFNYLEEIRKVVGIYSDGVNTSTQTQPLQAPETPTVKLLTSQPKAEEQTSSEDFSSENYRLLNEIAPDLEKEITAFENGDRLEGKSTSNVYGAVLLKVTEKDKRGYYLSLEVNESSKPSLEIALYYNMADQTVLTLSHEDSNGRLDVYDDRSSRKMIDPYQQKTQEVFLNNKLKKFIQFNLLIPSLDLETKQEQEQRKRKEQEERRKAEQKRTLEEYFQSRTWSPSDELEQDDSEELKEQIETLEQENERIKKATMTAIFENNMRLFKAIIPSLDLEFELRSFNVLVYPANSSEPEFRMEFDFHPNGSSCCVYDLNAAETSKVLAVIVLEGTTEAMFMFNELPFSNLRETYHTMSYEIYSEQNLRTNAALANWLLMLSIKGYQTKITDRVHKAESKNVLAPEVEELEAVEESDGTGTFFAVLGAIGLGILGVQLFKQ